MAAKKRPQKASPKAATTTKAATPATPTKTGNKALAYASAIFCVVCGGLTLALRALRLARSAARSEPLPDRLRQSDAVGRRRRHVPCASTSSCGARQCDRVVIDDWLPAAEVDALLRIANAGMAAAGADASSGGPTIFDINSGFVMAPGARLENLYQGRRASPPLFDHADYALYRSVIRRLKGEVEVAFSRERPLFFTAPTFITRLSGMNTSWQPAEAHDVYFQPHVDRDNTAHYEYSGLLYLSDYGVDFAGGLFSFDDGLEIEPKRGRVSMFGSGPENEHAVAPVVGGARFTLSFWFTCDENYRFADFLDGKAHARFGEGEL